MKLNRENEVVQKVARKAFGVVERSIKQTLSVKTKTQKLDVVTGLDIALDKLVASSLKRAFPYDLIVSEESSPGKLPGEKRTWVIDPLCGSMNAAFGIKFFCTNIVLVEGGRVVASWVVDHSRREVIWSLGGGVFRNGTPVPRLAVVKPSPMIDCDFGYAGELGRNASGRYVDFVKKLFSREDLRTLSLEGSLAFAYVATGQIQAATVINVRPWDILAACFLVERNGGVVANFDGTPYGIYSRSVVISGNKKIHGLLIKLLRGHGLHKVK